MIGCAYLWGTRRPRPDRRRDVLAIFRNGIDSAVMARGREKVTDLGPEDILVPDGFVRRLGA
jgi:pre-mycofactocin synthase